ncbi:heme ABC exporter ATP-binding protein CcmA [Pontixanthobacter sp.]|uniref:heme ABC exporter ATP-binding protein CcmA n=1 Tax=Pontixanthobacter sp. TaxID=2792078 RepID=UPI003C7E2601
MQARSLTAHDIVCRRGDRILFGGVRIAASPGEALHITGANGIGKSSLMRILAGLMAPFSGTVTRTGTIGMVDERPALDPQLPLGAAIAFWAQLDGAANMDRHAERLGLAELLEVPVRYLSTGQKKRAALVRLLGQNADIWLLDEPLNGLDRDGAELVEALVAEYRADGGIAIIASHQSIRLPAVKTLDLREFIV